MQVRRPSSRTSPQVVAYLHDNASFGGVETLQLRILERLDRTRYRPAVILAGAPNVGMGAVAERLADLDVTIVAVPASSSRIRGGFGRVLAIRRQLLEVGADVTHIQTRTPEAGRSLTIASWLARTPARIRTEHVSPGPHVTRLTRRRVAPFDHMTDLIVTDSKGDRQQQIELVGRDPDKVVASYCGIDPSGFDPGNDVDAAKRALGIDPMTTVIGTVARLHRQKGVRFLIEAAAHLADRSSEAFELLIVGDGPEEAEIRAQVADAGLTDRVRFVGFRADPLPFMQAMDIVAMPSLWEGFSISMQEFMALGKPIVSSDHHSFVEAFDDGVHGLHVPASDGVALGEALRRLLRDPELRHSLGAAAAERAYAEFSIDRHVNELMDLYDGLLRTPSAR